MASTAAATCPWWAPQRRHGASGLQSGGPQLAAWSGRTQGVLARGFEERSSLLQPVASASGREALSPAFESDRSRVGPVPGAPDGHASRRRSASRGRHGVGFRQQCWHSYSSSEMFLRRGNRYLYCLSLWPLVSVIALGKQLPGQTHVAKNLYLSSICFLASLSL